MVISRCVTEVRARNFGVSLLDRSAKLETLEFRRREGDRKFQFRVAEVILIYYSKSLRLQNMYQIRQVQF